MGFHERNIVISEYLDFISLKKYDKDIILHINLGHLACLVLQFIRVMLIHVTTGTYTHE